MSEHGFDADLGGLVSGCGFLSTAEVEEALNGNLPAPRQAELDDHVASGCSDCVLLAADLRVFRAVSTRGVLKSERREADRGSEMLAARLRRAVGQPGAVATGRALPRRWSGPLAVAASVVLALAGWLVLKEPAHPTLTLADGSTYQLEEKPFSAPPILRDRQALADLWAKAGSAYTARRFARAERLLADIETVSPSETDAVLYRGVCLLMLDRPGEAREVLKRARQLAEQQDLPSASIDWYAALAALADGDPAAARQELESASREGGVYGEKAEQLMPRVD